MLRPFRKIVQFASSSKGAKITLLAWLVVVAILSVIAPGAKEYAGSSKEMSVKENQPSEIAEQIMEEQFPSDDGVPALLVFHRDGNITDQDREKLTELSEWLASNDRPRDVSSALPYHQFPKDIQDQMFSEDGSTLLFNLSMKPDLDSDKTLVALDQIRDKVKEIGLDELQFEITGPAGISADTISLFRNADFVLMLATVVLIFIILILIYRSPLLALTPLVIAGIVYGAVDRILGLAGKNDWFTVDSSANSIMLVLLFAVLTDYSLFVFSRYREELSKQESKYDAMGEAIYHVSEPIVFSGGTVFLAMLTLFTTIFQPYNHFAPVFSVAVVVILVAGLTLIPSIFALMGRKAFWPFIPKVEKKEKKEKGIWHKISQLVKKHPAVMGGLLLIVLLVGIFNFTSMKFSFNLLKSFPEDMPSRQGFELLEDNYPAGQLAPVTIILKSSKEIKVNEELVEQVNQFESLLKKHKGVDSVSPSLSTELPKEPEDLPRNFLADSQQALKLQVVLAENPYSVEALDTVQDLLDSSEKMLEESGFTSSDVELHYAGQTAQQLDVRTMNQRDMIVLFSLVTILLTVILGFQTKSVLMPILMMGTILLSYFASLGFSWWIFKHGLGYDAISYRLPVYTFVFMVALGIDYNIMLVSRIREEALKLPWKDAVAKGVSVTGGVISSAGLILAATFAVLMTQPLQELFLFGFTMALGILLDTFLIRGIFLPSILILTHGKNK
ncbi:MMPL family transporter [Bacillus sp. SD088]|uniref:MMPL family transporter n=1 Tax=Bacillus sp. SD088 TaxID=2782012 RepID=UPI001A96E20A|nr:MMPL family transporter [Bacillus sp. SD088]MBO0995060.1 MMPL family transporter [Bacillus sp. SD088]